MKSLLDEFDDACDQINDLKEQIEAIRYDLEDKQEQLRKLETYKDELGRQIDERF